MSKRLILVYSSAIVAMVFWSFSFIWYKEVLILYKPISLVLLRLIISSIFLFVVTSSIRKLNKLHLKDLKLFLLLAFLEPFVYFMGESYGISLVPSTVAAVVISTIPLFSPIGAYYLLKERISWMNFAGIIVSVVGVALVIFHQGFELIDVNPLGVAFLFVAVASALGYSLVIKKLTDRYNVFSIVTYQNTLGIFFFLPFFFLFDFKNFISVVPTWDVVFALLKLGIFASTVAFILFTFSIKNLGITKANIFTNAIPVLTAIFAYFILDEAMTAIKIVGIVVVITGLIISQYRRGLFTGFFRNGKKAEAEPEFLIHGKF